MNERLFIGIDNGTQGTKVIVYSEQDKKIVASSYSKHEIIENNSGKREQKPEWWIAAARQCLNDVLSKVDKSKIVAIGVSGQQHGCVPLDENGSVIRPAKLWCDTETAEECDIMTTKLGGLDNVVKLIGNSIAAGFTASKIMWLKLHEPENYEKARMFLLPHDYLNYWLTGNYVTDMGDASGTAYFDVRNRKWCKEILDVIDDKRDWERCLPKVLKFNESAGKVRKEISEEFGIPETVIVSSGGGDNMMAAIGTGNVIPGVITCSLGTSGTLISYADTPIVDPKGELAAFCSSSGGWMPLICTMNVTVCTEQVRNLLGVSLDEFNKLAEEAEPGSEGIVILPYFNGERTPARPHGKAVFSGITSANFTRQNMARSAFEGATFSLRYGLEILEKLGIKKTEIRLVGGGSKSSIWRHIVADIFNCPVICPDASEAGAMGCVIQSMACLGEDIKKLCEQHIAIKGEKIMPNKENAAEYEKMYKQYISLDKCTQ